MTKLISAKMGIQEGMRAYLLDVPVEAGEAIELPQLDLVA